MQRRATYGFGKAHEWLRAYRLGSVSDSTGLSYITLALETLPPAVGGGELLGKNLKRRG